MDEKPGSFYLGREYDVQPTAFGIAWEPFWQVSYRDGTGAVRTAALPAYQGGASGRDASAIRRSLPHRAIVDKDSRRPLRSGFLAHRSRV